MAGKCDLVIDSIKGVVYRRFINGTMIRAGWMEKRGYWYVGKKSVHSLVWTHVNGTVPEGLEIDHINGNRSDNRISNLRVVNRSQNGQNRHYCSGKNKTSGVKGVHWDAERNKWRTHIVVNQKQIYLGRYPTLAEAHRVYREAAAKYHTHNPHAAGRSC